jgi:hypothetical protein
MGNIGIDSEAYSTFKAPDASPTHFDPVTGQPIKGKRCSNLLFGKFDSTSSLIHGTNPYFNSHKQSANL